MREVLLFACCVKFKTTLDVPSLCLAQVEKLVIGSKYDVAAAVDAEICFHKGIGQMVFLQTEVMFSWLFRPKAGEVGWPVLLRTPV